MKKKKKNMRNTIASVDETMHRKINTMLESPVVKNIGQSLSDGFRLVSAQAKRLGQSAKVLTVQAGLKMKIAHANAIISQQYRLIGEQVYELFKKNKRLSFSERMIARTILNIQTLEKEIAALNKELSAYK
jgi:hypothetical protein